MNRWKRSKKARSGSVRSAMNVWTMSCSRWTTQPPSASDISRKKNCASSNPSWRCPRLFSAHCCRKHAPRIPGLNVAAFSRPAQIVGGDYFDFVPFKDGGHGFVMADVSGHGVSASMLMTSLQTAFHTLVPGAESPLEVLERINHLYMHNINFTTFVTIFFGKLDPLRARSPTPTPVIIPPICCTVPAAKRCSCTPPAPPSG